MKKSISFMLAILFLIVFSIPAYAETSNNKILSPICEYLSNRYDCIANLKVQPDSKKLAETNEGATFLEIEAAMLKAEVWLLSSASENLKYRDYKLYVDFSTPIVKGSFATVYASAVCKFNYEATPDIDSEYGILYRFDLKQTGKDSWEIVGRSYPTLFDKAFWNDTAPDANWQRQEAAKSSARFRTAWMRMACRCKM